MTNLNYKDIVKVNDTYYEKIQDEVSLDELGFELGEVKFMTPKTNGKYEFVNYEASRLKIGTKVFELEDDEFIAVEIINSSKVYQKYKIISSMI